VKFSVEIQIREIVGVQWQEVRSCSWGEFEKNQRETVVRMNIVRPDYVRIERSADSYDSIS
jgi:hypothetical protein